MKIPSVVLVLTVFSVLALSAFTTGGIPAPVEAEPVAAVEAATFVPDRSHSQVGFKVRHLGIANVRGVFNDYDATVRFDPSEVQTLQVEATIAAASIDTDNARRDEHLRSDDFFDAEQYPEITFVSTEVRNIDGPAFELVGDLTIRGITKEVVFEGEFLGAGVQRGRQKVGFEAETTINRFDYGLKWDRLTEAGGLVVGENVEILVEMELEEAESAG